MSPPRALHHRIEPQRRNQSARQRRVGLDEPARAQEAAEGADGVRVVGGPFQRAAQELNYDVGEFVVVVLGLRVYVCACVCV
jgi:hypothetical protein